MEPLAPPAFNPHLKRVLKSYQSAALKSLSGPSNYVAAWGDPAKLSPNELKAMLALSELKREGIYEGRKLDLSMVGQSPGHSGVSSQHMPLFLPMDSTRSEKSETILEGETIACFVVGGEKRLCLPQILNTVLREFSLQQINTICDELHIFCSRCNSDQLDILKVTGVLPLSAPSCGLITKTDAERLCNALLHRTPEKSRDPPTANAFKVYHECFGKCKGIFSPELYTSPYAKCIECFDCHGLFSPQKFVVHSHKALENRTCHWGFDSANWRSYLLLAKDQDGRDQCQRILEDIKARFDFTSRFKRKESPDGEKDESKRVRYEESSSPSKVYDWADSQYRATSAFRPWSPGVVTAALKEGKIANLPQFRDGITKVLPPYLQTGPPVLLNPERVIPLSESNRYERHFAPNVSLAPACQQKGGKDRDEDEENTDSETVIKEARKEVVSDGIIIVQPSTCSKIEDSLEIDTSSSDFESSVKTSSDSSVPSTPGAETTSSTSCTDLTPTDMLRTALDGCVADSQDARDAFMEQFLKIQHRQDERLHALDKANQKLQRDLDQVRLSKKEQLRDVQESKRQLRLELEKEKMEGEAKMKQVAEEKSFLKKELEVARALHKQDVSMVKSKYKEQVDHLQGQLQRRDAENADMRREIEALRRQFEKLGQELPKVKVIPAGGAMGKAGGDRQVAETNGTGTVMVDGHDSGPLTAAGAAAAAASSAHPSGHS